MPIIPEHLQIDFAPVADPNAVVTAPNVRFTVLTPRMIRMEYSPDDVVEDRASQSFWYRRQAVPEFSTRHDGDTLEIETEKLILRYSLSEQGFSAQTLSVTVKDTGTIWHYGEHDTQNLRGTYRTLDAVDGGVALPYGLLSRAGWSVVDDSAALVFDDSSWLIRRDAHADALDLYFFGYGLDYKTCLHDYCLIAGKTPLLPRWVLGNWWSRFNAYTQQELMQLIHDFEQHQIPLSVCIIDMDWHITDTGNASSGWTGYTWNKDFIPEPEALLNFIHSRGLRTALNLHPADGAYPHEAMYPQMARRMGIEPESKTPIPFNIADPEFTNAYFEILHHPMEAQGVDFWWLDWQQGTKSALTGLDPLWWLNHLHFYDLSRDGKRPFVFSRWGGYGNHRYPIGFSGDAVVSWKSLAFQPYFTATAANVGYGWWSHDIGGHGAGQEDDELYCRWIQFGVFSPIMRIHSTQNPFVDRRPWMHDPGTLHIIREAMQLRHALIPYLYTLSWLNHTEDLPPVRPMYQDYPEQDAAYACPDQYLFGDLIVAPYIQPMDAETRLSRQVIWLPEGDWYDFFTGEAYQGGQWHARYGGIETIPVFAKAGTIVPLGPKVAWGGVDNPPVLDVHVFAGADGGFTLYEDDGNSIRYHDGAYCQTRFTQSWSDRQLTLAIMPAEGDVTLIPSQRQFNLYIHGIARPDSLVLTVDDALVRDDWTHDSQTQTLFITLRSVSPEEAVKLVLSTEKDELLSRPDHKAETIFRMMNAFRMKSNAKARIYQHLRESGYDPIALKQDRPDLTDNQLRALLEVLLEAGFHVMANKDTPALIVAWNNLQDKRVTYRFDWARHIWEYQSAHEVIPQYKIFNPGVQGQPIEYYEGQAHNAKWRIQVDYAGIINLFYGAGVVS